MDEHLDNKYGKVGTINRTEYESKAHAFVIGELLKDERQKANITQEELAEKQALRKVIFQELKMDVQTYSFRLDFHSLLCQKLSPIYK